MRFATILRCLFSGTAFLLALTWTFAPVAQAGTQDLAKVVFHSQPWSKAPCSDGSALAVGTDCATYDMDRLPLLTKLHVYLVVVGDPVFGLGGVQCGINYDQALGSGVDILSWTSCSAVEFPSAGPNGAWPSAGSGNRIVWSECQDAVPSGGTFAQAVAGAFYVYAYGDDFLEATPDRTGICYGELVVTDCQSNLSDLMPPVDALGGLGFGSMFGWNPCNSFADGALCGVSDRALDFGTVVIGDSRDLTIRIQDVGFGFGLPSFDVGPLDGGDFTIVSGEGHYERPVQDPVDVTFRFTPTAMGAQEATFEVVPCTLCPPVTLTGLGDVVTPVERARWGEVKARYE